MFRGSLVALVTPFKRDGSVDRRRLLDLVDRQLAGGTDGIVPCGTTGEAATLRPAERAAVVRLVSRHVRGRVPVIAGTGTNSTAVTIDLSKDARRAGADAVLAVTPYYNKPTQAGLLAHYRHLAREVALPIVLYNVPSRTAVSLTPETVARLSEVRGIVAIKEAGGIEQAGRILALCGIVVLSGDDAITLPMMAIGGKGVVSVVANLVPDRVQEMVSAAERGDWAIARALHHRLQPLIEACFWESNPGPVKAMLARLGRIGPAMRLPLVPPMPETQKRLKRLLDRQGLTGYRG